MNVPHYYKLATKTLLKQNLITIIKESNRDFVKTNLICTIKTFERQKLFLSFVLSAQHFAFYFENRIKNFPILKLCFCALHPFLYGSALCANKLLLIQLYLVAVNGLFAINACHKTRYNLLAQEERARERDYIFMREQRGAELASPDLSQKRLWPIT